MPVHDTITHLGAVLAALDAALEELALLVADLPDDREDAPAIVEAIGDAVESARGRLHDVATMTRASANARTLAAAHATLNEIARHVRTELNTAGHLVEITAIANARGGAWTRWSREAEQALERTAAATEAIAPALLDCWRELVEQHRIPAA